MKTVVTHSMSSTQYFTEILLQIICLNCSPEQEEEEEEEEPSQPQRIISGLKTNFSLSPSYSAYQPSNHKFCKVYKISPDINLYKAKHSHTDIKQNFRRISPFDIAHVNQHVRLVSWILPSIYQDQIFLSIKRNGQKQNKQTKNQNVISI